MNVKILKYGMGYNILKVKNDIVHIVTTEHDSVYNINCTMLRA